jgi:hypothetical protein
MSNSQKLSIQTALGNIAKNGAEDVVSLLARALPASVVTVNGSIVRIKFEVLTEYNLPILEIPVAGSAYVREPIQIGDKGMVIPCGASIAAVSGMGQNTADLSSPPNLSALVFFPLGNKLWSPVDSKMLVLSGITDVMLRDAVHQVQLETVFASWNALISQLNTILGTIGPLLTTPQVLGPLDAVTLNPVKPRQ